MENIPENEQSVESTEILLEGFQSDISTNEQVQSLQELKSKLDSFSNRVLEQATGQFQKCPGDARRLRLAFKLSEP